MTPLPRLCPCDPKQLYSQCCGRFITNQQLPINAEQLMRSRYSAYATGHYQYIIDTYADIQDRQLNPQQLAEGQTNVIWRALQIVSTVEPDYVEFQAFYTIQKDWYVLHENSKFIQKESKWLYLNGTIINDSKFIPQRNQMCPCGSSKKFKKCCLQ